MTDPDHIVTLWANGRIHAGWKEVSITLNLDHLAGDYSLGLTDLYLDEGRLEYHPIQAGAACRIAIDGVTVLTGWVDGATPAFTDTENSLSVSGRDATGDLVDCSAQVKEYLDQTLDRIAVDLCTPFGIPVRVDTDTGAPFARFAVNTGDTVQTCLERLCRQRGVMAWSDGVGGLVIGRGTVGCPVAELVRGRTVLAASAPDDFSGRFSALSVRGTRETPDSADASVGSQEEGVATDPAVTRYRPKIMVAETQGSTLSLTDRARHEQRVAQGKGRKVSATVRGWTHAGGLWRPGQTVTFNDTRLGIRGDWLLGNVTFRKSDTDGTVSRLTLYPPGAFDILAEPEEN